MSFQQFSLHPKVLAGVKSVGFTSPTPIQQQAIPVAMEGRDVLGLAQTGTGKTAAFALPILHHLATTPPRRGIRALIIAPTRELAEQINQTFVNLGGELGVRSIAIYGGVAKGPQITGVRRGAQVVVACPGRLLDHVSQKDIDISKVEILVLDEADTMCDMGFLPDVQRILNHVPNKRQTLFLSATMPTEIRSLAVKILKDPATVQIGAIAPAKTVSHALYPVPDKLKKNLLLALLEQTATGRALVFTRTKHRARTLALDLSKKRYRVAALQGNMSQTARQQAMNGFRDGKFDILVATDIAAHGIDVPEVSHVINFDFPNTADTYTHRIGRTGRAEHTGEAFTLAVANDQAMVREVEKELGKKIERRRLPGFEYGDFAPEKQFPDLKSGQPNPGGGNRTRQSRNGSGRRPSGGNGAKSRANRYQGSFTSNGRGQYEDGTPIARPSPFRSSVDGGERFENGNGRTGQVKANGNGNNRRFQGHGAGASTNGRRRSGGGPNRMDPVAGGRFEGDQGPGSNSGGQRGPKVRSVSAHKTRPSRSGGPRGRSGRRR